MTSGGQTIKVVQAGGNIMSTGKQTFSAGQMLNIGGQTVRLATPGGTLLKAGSTLTGHGGKQVILQKQGNQPQIVTLVKTSQGMQVATVPKSTMGQGGKTTTSRAGSPQIIQTSSGAAMTTTMAGVGGGKT